MYTFKGMASKNHYHVCCNNKAPRLFYCGSGSSNFALIFLPAMLCLTLFIVALTLHEVTVLSYADDFNCSSLPPLTKHAQSVYELRPQDIKVVMALGDSVTAGMINHQLIHHLFVHLFYITCSR